jgi:zinc protease
VPRSTNYFSIWIRPVQTAEGLKKQYSELEAIKIGHAHFALRMAINELEMMIQKGMSQEDFELTRDFLRSYMKLYVQTPSRQLGYLMDSKFYGRSDYIKEMDVLLANLKLEDVNKAIKKYWQTQKMYIAIVTDDSEAEPLKESLLNNLASPMSYSDALKASLPATILEEDDRVSKVPLNVKKVTIVESDGLFR